MKKNLYTLFAAIALLFTVVAANAQVNVYFTVEMAAAMLGEDAACPQGIPFTPGTDVVEPMGQEYNAWTATTVDCGTAFVPDAAQDMQPIFAGSTIYSIVKYGLIPDANSRTTFKYRIDHAWGNDELRGVGDGNRHALIPAGATNVVIFSVFDDSTNVITVVSGIQNPVLAQIQKIYPNPSSDVSTLTYFVLNSDVVNINLTDATGRVVKEVLNAKQGFGAQQLNLNTSDLAPGMYIVNVRVGNSLASQKLSVVR